MEPERPIEKVLRNAARKRRQQAEGASFTLHPATRRLLQGEVARQFPPAPAPVRKNIWLLWPRLAGAAALCLLLGLGVWMLIPGNEPDQPVRLAQAPVPLQPPGSTDLGTELNLSPPPASTAPVTRGQLENSPVLDRLAANESLDVGLGGRESAPASTARVPVEKPDRLSEATVMNGLAQSNRLLADASSAAPANNMFYGGPRSEQPTPAEPTASPGSSGVDGFAGPTGQIALGLAVAPSEAPAEELWAGRSTFENKAPNQKVLSNVQQFTRSVKPDEAKAKGLPARDGQTPVLATFAVEQAGKELRIIDNDGSVYSGSLEMTPVAAQSTSVARTASAPTAGEPTARRYGSATVKRERSAAPPAQTAAAIPSQLLSFRVAGTNRTLNQNVVFIGNFAQPVPSSVGYELTNAVQAPSHLSKDKVGNSLPQALSSRILGKAMLDDGKEIEVEAVPSKQ